MRRGSAKRAAPQTMRSGQSRTFEDRRKRRFIMGTVSGVLGFAAWAFVFYKISVMPSLALTEIRVYGAEGSVSNRIQAAAYSALSGSYFGFISKANALFYPEHAVAAAVTAASPGVSSVSVGRDGYSVLTITVAEKTPAAIACASLPNFDDNGSLSNDPSPDCYFADDTGYIFKRVGSAPEDGFDRFYVPNVTLPAPGHYATSTAMFKALEAFISGAKADGMKPEGILVKAGGEYELYIDNPDGSVAIVYFNESAKFATELSNLSAFWNTMSRGKAHPPNFEYIDVRYGTNVFYRLIRQTP